MKTFYLMIVLFCTTVLASCSNKTEVTDEPKTSAEIKITVVLPDGWKPVENSVLEHQYMKGTASFMIKNESVLDGKKLDDAVNEAKTQIGNYFDDISFADNKTLKVDGNEAILLPYTYSVAAAGMTITMKMEGIYTMVGNKCYLITFGDMKDNFDNLSADFQSILSGIKFVQ